MGQSSSSGQVLKPAQHGLVPQQQVQEPPYPGPAAQYNFINCQVSMSQKINFGFLNSSLVTSNVDAYYNLLAQQYEQGFRLLSFYHIPGQAHRKGVFSSTVLMPFQGIFCRYPTAPSNERFQLRIEKSIIKPQMIWNGIISTNTTVVTDTQHLCQTIANNTANGGRLICIELTGQEEVNQTWMGQHQPTLGCDMFFEIPMGGSQETYIYNVVSAPIHIQVHVGFTGSVSAHCDWVGILAANLSQGWKLVEIFMDQAQSTQVRGFTPRSQLNSQWFFEKPSSRASDPTPMYQGTVVTHEISLHQSGLGNVVTHANWEPIIQDMGNKGWELACILETPETQMKGLGSVTMKVLLFFQRRMLPPAGAQPYPPSAQPYPSAAQPYPPSAQPYPSAAQPYPPSAQPYPSAAQPHPSAEPPPAYTPGPMPGPPPAGFKS